jgi:hypothetical protein
MSGMPRGVIFRCAARSTCATSRRASGVAHRALIHRARAAREAACDRSSAVNRAALASPPWRRWSGVNRHRVVDGCCVGMASR